MFISASQNVEIHNNQLESNVRGIIYFIDCAVTGLGRSLDLTNNSAHDNTIRVGAQRGAIANGFTYTRQLQLNTAGRVSERLEEPDVLA